MDSKDLLKDTKREYYKLYRDNNKDKLNAYQREYRKQHKDKVQQYNQTYWINKLKKNGAIARAIKKQKLTLNKGEILNDKY